MGKSDAGQGAMKPGQDAESELKRGIALFNAREFFQAHEVWEDWWRATTHSGKQTIQGMIQVAAAMHHHSRGNLDGARSVMVRALRNLEDANDEFRGVNMMRLRDDIRRVIRELAEETAVTIFKIVWR